MKERVTTTLPTVVQGSWDDHCSIALVTLVNRSCCKLCNTIHTTQQQYLLLGNCTTATASNFRADLPFDGEVPATTREHDHCGKSFITVQGQGPEMPCHPPWTVWPWGRAQFVTTSWTQDEPSWRARIVNGWLLHLNNLNQEWSRITYITVLRGWSDNKKPTSWKNLNRTRFHRGKRYVELTQLKSGSRWVSLKFIWGNVSNSDWRPFILLSCIW